MPVRLIRDFICAAAGICILSAETIHLKTRELEPAGGPRSYAGAPLKRRSAGRSHYLIQFEGTVSARHFDEMRRRGIVVTAYLPTAVLTISAADDADLADLGARWIGRLEHRDKISPLITSRSGPSAYVVEFHSDVAMREARELVREHHLQLIKNSSLSGNHLAVAGWFGDIFTARELG